MPVLLISVLQVVGGHHGSEFQELPLDINGIYEFLLIPKFAEPQTCSVNRGMLFQFRRAYVSTSMNPLSGTRAPAKNNLYGSRSTVPAL